MNSAEELDALVHQIEDLNESAGKGEVWDLVYNLLERQGDAINEGGSARQADFIRDRLGFKEAKQILEVLMP